MNSVYKKMASGAAWTISYQVGSQFISFLSTLILARLLMPDDFGLIALSYSLMALIELLGAFSLHVTLIQKRDIDRTHYDTAWTLGLIINGASALLLVAIAGVAADFMNEPRLTYVVYFLALTFLIDAAANTGVVQFQRDMDFRKDFMFMLGPKFVGFLVTIPLAIVFRSYWVLVAGALVTRTTSLILSYVLHDLRPRLTLARAAEFYHMSKWLIANNLITYVLYRSPALFLGRMSTTRSVGLFTISFEVASLPTTNLVQPINRAVFPGYSKISGESEKLGKAFLDVVQTISLIILPLGIGIASVAEVAVPVLLGNRWHDAIPIVQILAVSGAATCMLSNVGSVYLSLGKPQLMTLQAGLKATVMVTAVVTLAPQFGAMGVAYAMLLGEAIALPIGLVILKRVIGVGFTRYLRAIYRPVLGVLVMFAAVTLLVDVAAIEEGAQLTELLSRLAVFVLAGAATYFVVVFGLWWLAGKPSGPEKLALEWAGKKFRRSPEGAADEQ